MASDLGMDYLPLSHKKDARFISFVLFMSCVCHAFASVHCCLVVTCWERDDLLLLFVMLICVFITFPCGILGQVWYLIVSIPDLCHLSYFYIC